MNEKLNEIAKGSFLRVNEEGKAYWGQPEGGGGGGGGGSVPKPLTYDYMPDGYPTKTVQTTTLMEEQEVAFADMGGVYAATSLAGLELIEGQTYTVVWDGTEYERVCVAVYSTPVLGNLSILDYGDNTGEPFLYIPAQGMATSDTSATHTISVKTIAETVTPMAEEFLPETLATKSEVEVVQTTATNAQTAADNAQTVANSNKEVLYGAFATLTFTFDKQISGRDTFVFNNFDYYKISDFNPAPENVTSFKGTRESGAELSKIDTGNNCVGYGFFIIVASAGDCSLPVTETVAYSFTAPSAGLYACYTKNNTAMTAGTGEFTLRASTGSLSITGLLLKSSTADSTKKFKITVDDSGTISATEVT